MPPRAHYTKRGPGKFRFVPRPGTMPFSLLQELGKPNQLTTISDWTINNRLRGLSNADRMQPNRPSFNLKSEIANLKYPRAAHRLSM